jgi:hypothetical protein
MFKAPITTVARYGSLMIEVSLGFGIWDLGFRQQ